MKDLIDRQAAITQLSHNKNKGDDEWKLAVAYDILTIWKLPSTQPETIRCKDCKYMTEHYDTDGNAPYWTCSEWDSGTDYDGFCHYAERRNQYN